MYVWPVEEEVKKGNGLKGWNVHERCTKHVKTTVLEAENGK